MIEVSTTGHGQRRTRKMINTIGVDTEPGWPLVFAPDDDVLGKMGTPALPTALVNFAGVTTGIVANGDEHSSGLIELGYCEANLYRPTAAEIVSGPYVSPVAGVHLLPSYNDDEGGFFVPVGFHTGIVLREDKSAAAEGAYLKVGAGGGAWVSFDAGEVRASGHFYFLAPAAASATALGSISYSGSAAAKELLAAAMTGAGIISPYARKVVIAWTATTDAHIAAGTGTIVYLDAAGVTRTETFTFVADTEGSYTTLYAAVLVVSVNTPAMDSTSVTVTIGTTDVLALLKAFPQKPVVLQSRVDDATDSAPTLTVSATIFAANTIDPSTACDGAKDFEFWLKI